MPFKGRGKPAVEQRPTASSLQPAVQLSPQPTSKATTNQPPPISNNNNNNRNDSSKNTLELPAASIKRPLEQSLPAPNKRRSVKVLLDLKDLTAAKNTSASTVQVIIAHISFRPESFNISGKLGPPFMELAIYDKSMAARATTYVQNHAWKNFSAGQCIEISNFTLADFWEGARDRKVRKIESYDAPWEIHIENYTHLDLVEPTPFIWLPIPRFTNLPEGSRVTLVGYASSIGSVEYKTPSRVSKGSTSQWSSQSSQESQEEAQTSVALATLWIRDPANKMCKVSVWGQMALSMEQPDQEGEFFVIVRNGRLELFHDTYSLSVSDKISRELAQPGAVEIFPLDSEKVVEIESELPEPEHFLQTHAASQAKQSIETIKNMQSNTTAHQEELKAIHQKLDVVLLKIDTLTGLVMKFEKK